MSGMAIAAAVSGLYMIPAVRKVVDEGVKEVKEDVEAVGSAISSGVDSVEDAFATLGKTIDSYI